MPARGHTTGVAPLAIAVGEGGLEPPRPCGHRNLNPAGPIPDSTNEWRTVSNHKGILGCRPNPYQAVAAGWVAIGLQPKAGRTQ